MDYNKILIILQQGANVRIKANPYSLNQLRAFAREAARKDTMLTVECCGDILTVEELKLLAQEGGRNITIEVR